MNQDLLLYNKLQLTIFVVTWLLAPNIINCQGLGDLTQLRNDFLMEEVPNKRFKLQDSFIFEVRDVNVDTFLKYAYDQIERGLNLMSYDTVAETAAEISYYEINEKKNKIAGLSVIEKVLPYEEEFKNSKNRGLMYAKLGGIYFTYNNYESAIENYQIAISKYGSKDTLFIADMHLFSGQAQSGMGAFLEAINSLRQAYELYLLAGDREYAMHALSTATDLYGRNGLYAKALSEYELIDSVAQIDQNIMRLYGNAYNRAAIYGKQGNSKKQLEFLEKALSYQQNGRKQLPFAALSIHAALCVYHIDQGSLSQARFHLDSIAYYFDHENAAKLHTWQYLQAHSQFHMASKQVEKARPFIEKSLELFNSWDNMESKMYTYKAAQEYYALSSNTDRAYHYLEQLHTLQDSLRKKEDLNKLLYYQTAFETERQAKEIAIQREENTLLRIHQEKMQRWMIASFTGLLTLFALVYLYISRKNALASKAIQEGFTQRLIDHQEEEKKRVSESLHDSLGQSLLLIKNKVILTNDRVSQSIIDQAINEVSSISKSLHPLQLEQLGLTKAIESIISSIDESTDIFLSSELHDVDHLFTNKEALNIYRISQESLSNVVKHSGASAARIELMQGKGEVSLIIKDNGKGFDFTEEYQKLGSLGLKTLKGRVAILNGSLTFNSIKNEGTEVVFKFPT